MHTRLAILFTVLLTEAPWRCGLAQPAPRLDLERRISGLEISWPGSLPRRTEYLPGISCNPTAAAYWDQFAANPDEPNHGLERGQQGWRSKDYRLSEDEFAVITRNGFVVSERLGARSFAEVFYDLWRNDLPVFISCDALLQAWHRTFDAMLEEIEETYLYGSVAKMLDGMAGQLAAAATEVGDGVLRDRLFDADYFLTVGRLLLAGSNSPPIISAQ